MDKAYIEDHGRFAAITRFHATSGAVVLVGGDTDSTQSSCGATHGEALRNATVGFHPTVYRASREAWWTVARKASRSALQGLWWDLRMVRTIRRGQATSAEVVRPMVVAALAALLAVVGRRTWPGWAKVWTGHHRGRPEYGWLGR